MNRDDIRRMAKEAGIYMGGHPMNPLNVYLGDLERFAALVADHEREACCKIVYGLCESDNVAQRTVEVIRARGEENKS